MGGLPSLSLGFGAGPSSAESTAATQGSTINAPFTQGLTLVDMLLIGVAVIVAIKMLKG